MKTLIKIYMYMVIMVLSYSYYIEYMKPDKPHWPVVPYPRDATLLEKHMGILIMSITLPLAILTEKITLLYNILLPLITPIIARNLTPEFLAQYLSI